MTSQTWVKVKPRVAPSILYEIEIPLHEFEPKFVAAVILMVEQTISKVTTILQKKEVEENARRKTTNGRT